MKFGKFLTVLALAGISSAALAAPKSSINANRVTKSTTVSYQCAKGGRLAVKYGFNANGIPVTASAKVAGATRVMRYDLDLSDDVGSYFKDTRGYRLGSEAMEQKNVRSVALATVTAPNGSIVYKDCAPR